MTLTTVWLPEQAVVKQQTELQTRLQQLGEVAEQLPSLPRMMDELDSVSQQLVTQGRAQVHAPVAPMLLMSCGILWVDAVYVLCLAEMRVHAFADLRVKQRFEKDEDDVLCQGQAGSVSRDWASRLRQD